MRPSSSVKKVDSRQRSANKKFAKYIDMTTKRRSMATNAVAKPDFYALESQLSFKEQLQA